MVGTAQANDYSIFIRKIGYSVGLENLLARAGDFGVLYSSQASLSYSDWTSMVHQKWNLDSLNIEDVFGSLDIAHFHNREVFAGVIGESLGIVHQAVSGAEYQQATKFLIALAVIHADGDIFLNGLNCSFQKERMGKALVDMVSHKREALFDIFQYPRDREAVAHAVSIDLQATNKGGKSPGGLEALTRGAPLGMQMEALGLPRATDIHKVVPPSGDYLRKVTVTRSRWAESLGLFKDGETTEAGHLFLESLGRSGLACRDGVFCVWPTTFEVESNRFDLESFKSLPLLTTWDYQLAIYKALGGKAKMETKSHENASLIRNVKEFFDAYKKLAANRAMIRNEVPVGVIYAAYLARQFAQGKAAAALPAALESDAARRSVVVRTSRTIEGAVSYRAHASRAT